MLFKALRFRDMNSPTGFSIIPGENSRRWTTMVIIQPNRGRANRCLLFLYPSCRAQWFSGGAESARFEFSGQNAYELLGVSETSSFAEIKASFHKLAKQTHPDLAESTSDSAASQRFVQILAAYEILSDSEKRAHYDCYIFSQRKLVQKRSREGAPLNAYKSHVPTYKQMEVVEWLKWYRSAIKDILLESRVVVGTGYFDVLERDFYSAIHQAYYGPLIESMDFLPDRFEAEERSVYETPEVLHLVSGRDLFGMVCVVNRCPELSFCSKLKLNYSLSADMGIWRSGEGVSISTSSDGMNDYAENSQSKDSNGEDHKLHAYSDLELHVYGRLVAVGKRVPPKGDYNGMENKEEDRIHVFLNSNEFSEKNSNGFTKDPFLGDAVGSRIPLGTIIGLGTSPEEGSCFVYNNSGTKTHMIMKHRTLLVRHMHWYGVGLGEEVSVCECRCSRARLPPSKFWLFEPRCGMHDIGGWYIETFGRDKKGRTVPSLRYWDGFDPSEQFERRLHPAMYLLGLAYRTLDLEDARIRKRTIMDVVERKLTRILNWCKKLV